jgi:hypothetical protein
MDATAVTALCANLLTALKAAALAEDDTALFAVEAAALDALLGATPACFEGCARKAAALLEWYEKAGADHADAAQAIIDDVARLTGCLIVG